MGSFNEGPLIPEGGQLRQALDKVMGELALANGQGQLAEYVAQLTQSQELPQQAQILADDEVKAQQVVDFYLRQTGTPSPQPSKNQ